MVNWECMFHKLKMKRAPADTNSTEIELKVLCSIYTSMYHEATLGISDGVQ